MSERRVRPVSLADVRSGAGPESSRRFGGLQVTRLLPERPRHSLDPSGSNPPGSGDRSRRLYLQVRVSERDEGHGGGRNEGSLRKSPVKVVDRR